MREDEEGLGGSNEESSESPKAASVSRTALPPRPACPPAWPPGLDCSTDRSPSLPPGPEFSPGSEPGQPEQARLRGGSRSGSRLVLGAILTAGWHHPLR